MTLERDSGWGEEEEEACGGGGRRRMVKERDCLLGTRRGGGGGILDVFELEKVIEFQVFILIFNWGSRGSSSST